MPTIAALHLADPVLIMLPMSSSKGWTAKSDSQNRPLRTVVTLDPNTGLVPKRENFDQRPWVDRLVGIGVAAHEGQLFGVFNRLLGLFTAVGLVLLSVSASVLWWRKRSVGLLGAPVPTRKPTFSWGLAALIAGFAVYLPMLGLSLLSVLLVERLSLRRVPKPQRWRGLQPV